MAITAATTAKDRVFRSDAVKSLFEAGLAFVDTTITFKQGDHIYFDDATNLIKRCAATANAATYLGISPVSITLGILAGPYDGLTNVTSQAPSEFQGPMYGFTALSTLKTGDTFNPGDKVYLADGADSQTVSVTDPGDANYVGIYVGAATTAAAGQQGTVKIGLRGLAGTGAALQF